MLLAESSRKSCVFWRKAVSLPTEIYIHDLFNVETMSNGRRHITPTHRIGRHIAAVAITLIALAACHYLPPFGGIRGGLSGRLGGVDSLVNSRPDSALTLLNSIAQDTAKMSRHDLMRYYLLRTNAENKCDTVLTARHAALPATLSGSFTLILSDDTYMYIGTIGLE